MSQVFGKGYAPAYDALYQDKDYDGEVVLLRRIFERYAGRPIRNILDMGCGTGNHTIRLAAGGYSLVGIDRSAEMLSLAGAKAREQTSTARFYQADIRTVELDQTFDAVLMMFAVLSYQIEDEDIRSVLKAARRHLPIGGLLVFDAWYGPAVLAQSPERRVRAVEQGGTTWVRSSFGQLDTLRHRCRVDFHLRQTRDDVTVEETRESHVVRYLFSQEIELFLDACGFRLLRLGAFPEIDREPDSTTWNVIAVAVAV